MEAEKVLQAFAIDFIEKHFDEIDLQRCEWDYIFNKENAINQIKKHSWMVGWVIMEVMHWGTKKNYTSDYCVENNEDRFVIKVDGRYFAHIGYHSMEEVFPQVVMVEKLVF